MEVIGKIWPRLAFNVAASYDSPTRVVMEPIDNSIDSSEGLTHPVEIRINISGRYYRNGYIRIVDNCTGIKELPKVVENIGNSDKKSQAWTNGQFGYGLFSFMAMCDILEIKTKHADNNYSEYIIIHRNKFLVDDLNDLKFEVTKDYTDLMPSGTEITYSGFSKESWLEFDVKKLKAEIENHFELLLHNPNLKVKITNVDGSFQCVPYNYSAIPGEVFHEIIPIYTKDNASGFETYRGDLEFFLRITPKVSVERPPVIISKNRRVIELFQLKSLRTNHKRDIYNNPCITGYYNANDLLQPTIARNDFKNTTEFRIVKKAILEAEERILEKVEQAFATNNTNDFSEIETLFNSKLDNLIDLMSEEKKPKANETVNITPIGELSDVLIPDPNGPLSSLFPSRKGTSMFNNNGKPNSFQPITNMTSMSKSREFIETSKSNERKLRIRIDDISEPIQDNAGIPKRSELFGNEIVIYKKHPDFIARIITDATSRIEKISSNLITYISCETLIHYTNFKYTQSATEQQADIKQDLVFFTDSLYKLEQSLKGLNGKQLSK